MTLNAMLPERDEATILVTDSGLGGLSIFADILNGLRARRSYRKARLIYFNAWPEQDKGYNRLADTAERARVFDQALRGMMALHPDAIVIACNTLSAIYPETEFSRLAPIPVVDIIRFGVGMILAAWRTRRYDQVIIFGTPATVQSNAHRAALMAKGMAGDRIIPQPCEGLAGKIEKDPGGRKVDRLIASCVAEAADKARPQDRPVLAALCCTHYGYSREIFKRHLESRFRAGVMILDPNEAMADGLLPAARKRRSETSVRLDILSKIVWSPEKISSISGILETKSKATATALRNYRYDPRLFSPAPR